MAPRTVRKNNFPWWIVGIWTGILSALFYWLWNQRKKDPSIQPIQVDMSFSRAPSAPLPEPTLPAEVLVDGPANLKSQAEPAAEPAAAESTQTDDLTLIHGIGPKIASILQEAGIDSFKRLAQITPEHLREILQAANINIRLVEPESWPAQAQVAAQGNWDESKGASIRRQMDRDS
jgi:predicted flap endonuclease-1-like 5' DNA nuclease